MRRALWRADDARLAVGRQGHRRGGQGYVRLEVVIVRCVGIRLSDGVGVCQVDSTAPTIGLVSVRAVV